MTLPEPPLLVITDRHMPRPALIALVKELLDLARSYNAWVGVSADVQAMMAAQAHGLHLPQGMDVRAVRRQVDATRWIGVSAHSVVEVEAAATSGADYVTFSPVFPTPSKPGYGPALGLEALRQATQASPIPVVALGGITAENAARCIQAGAAGVAVMGEVMRAADPAAVTHRLVQSIQEGRLKQ